MSLKVEFVIFNLLSSEADIPLWAFAPCILSKVVSFIERNELPEASIRDAVLVEASPAVVRIVKLVSDIFVFDVPVAFKRPPVPIV